MLRRLTAMLLCLLLLPAAVFAEQEQPLPEPQEAVTQETLAAQWLALAPAADTPIYQALPSAAAPHAIGALEPAYLDSGLQYLNFIRQLAGLEPVALSDHLCVQAQYGAVLLAANDVLTHTPRQPADMDTAFFRMGANACGSANLSMRYGYPAESLLQSALQGHMDESSAANRLTLGHRRWLLNPKLSKVGFGLGEAASGRQYIVVPVTDETGEGPVPEAVFWPAAGLFPNNLFAPGTPWSVQLDPTQFAVPQEQEISVVVTRHRDGRQFAPRLLPEGASPDENHSYLLVSDHRYGTGSCISFSIGKDALGADAYLGDYSVSISGLFTTDGEPRSLTYTVRFFDAAHLSRPSDWALEEVTEAEALQLVPEALQDFYATPITRMEFCRLAMQMLRQLTGLDSKGLVKTYEKADAKPFFYDCADPDVLTAAAIGAVKGIGDFNFAPGREITRQDAAVLLWQAMTALTPWEEALTDPELLDLTEIAPYALPAVRWCAALQDPVSGRPVLSHTGAGAFAPLGTFTREQAILTMLRLYRAEQSRIAAEASPLPEQTPQSADRT